MNPPGKTTLNRMQLAAQGERDRIEICEDAHVHAGAIGAPRRDRVTLRDDFAGLVRLIEVIFADQVLLERVQEGIARYSLPTGIVPGEAAAELEEGNRAP